jgi:hypothetical protein
VPPFGEAAPRPVLRPPDQSGRQGVALDVAAGPHQATGFLDEMCLESSLIDGALSDRLPPDIHSDCMGSLYPMHEA